MLVGGPHRCDVEGRGPDPEGPRCAVPVREASRAGQSVGTAQTGAARGGAGRAIQAWTEVAVGYYMPLSCTGLLHTSRG